MKTILLLLLTITLNVSAQFLSFNKTEVISLLSKTNYSLGQISSEYSFIHVSDISGYACTYIFNQGNICIKEIIKSTNPEVVELVMDLDNTYYIRIGNVYWREETYGLVEVRKVKNTFTFVLKQY